MYTTVLITTGYDIRQRVHAVWSRYWPFMIMALSLLWLGVVLSQQSLDERIGQYATWLGQHHKTDPLVSSKLINVRSDAYQRGVELGALLQLLLKVLLPYLLLLSVISHYQYWYVARRLLLASDKAGKWGYAVILLLTLFILMGVSLFSFGKQAARAGVADAFPILTVGYLLGYSVLIHFRERQREESELAQAGRQAELDALKAQVNPPFLFHALQGLHQTAVDEHLPRTAQSLEQLTGITQYVLEESRRQTTDVVREMAFIRDYIRLQQLRVPARENIRITTEVDWDGQPATIAPLLLNPLIENAFKYGISIQHPCFVTIQFRVMNNILTFMTENSLLPGNNLERGTGLGLKNVRRRLELAYPDRHKLTIEKQEGVYKVELKIKLN